MKHHYLRMGLFAFINIYGVLFLLGHARLHGENSLTIGQALTLFVCVGIITIYAAIEVLFGKKWPALLGYSVTFVIIVFEYYIFL